MNCAYSALSVENKAKSNFINSPRTEVENSRKNLFKTRNMALGTSHILMPKELNFSSKEFEGISMAVPCVNQSLCLDLKKCYEEYTTNPSVDEDF